MKYMVLDTTTTEGVKFLAVEILHKASAWGQIYKHQGLTVIAPPLEGRGFAKLDLLQLQYLYWNTFQQTPPADMALLVPHLLAYGEKFPEGEMSVEQLQAIVADLYPNGVTGAPAVAKAPKEPKAPGTPSERPKANSTTGLVWDICDRELDKMTSKDDWKTVRAAIMAACEFDGINPATAATQYSKWKAAKLAVKAA